MTEHCPLLKAVFHIRSTALFVEYYIHIFPVYVFSYFYIKFNIFFTFMCIIIDIEPVITMEIKTKYCRSVLTMC